MVAEGSRVHGGTSFFQRILPFGHRTAPAASAKEERRVDAAAQNASIDRPPLLERRSNLPLDSNDAQPGANPSSFVDGAPQPDAPVDFGYARNMERRFKVGKEVARGGNGVVSLVEDVETGQEFAMKSIPKVLTDPSLSDKKRQEHSASIRREVEVMRRLRGCLNVASLEEVYEDDSHVHMVMEYCKGGELHHRIGQAHYSERTVASFMRATLRTLAQCHANKILHRDIKPGNFLLASDDVKAPLKAIDFGLAVFYNDKELPRTDLGLEGTPWFMAPEVLRSEVYPASDVWAAGVMAHQLLTGRFPFDDKSNMYQPSLSKVWKSILTDKIDFNRSHWAGISDEAKDFISLLLNKDPKLRPTAKEALKHPWLKGTIEDRHSAGSPLSIAVVQRIQRYSQSSLVKRSVLDLIAQELLADNPEDNDQVCPLNYDATPVIDDPRACPLAFLYERLKMADKELVDRAALAQGLTELGYKLSTDEVSRLLDQLDPGNTGHVAKSQIAASQIDWGLLQQNNTEKWLKSARRAFADLDSDKDGIVSMEDMVALLRHKLPPREVEAAVTQALQEAARNSASNTGPNPNDHPHDDSSNHGSSVGGSTHGGGSMNGGESVRNGMNFRQFLRMLNVGSADSLDLYDDRLGSLGSPGSFDRVHILLEKSLRGGEGYKRAASLAAVPEME